MKTSKRIFAFLASIIAASVACEAEAMLLTPGDIYTSNYFSNTISHYDVSGNFID